jgi:hypothetical protein
LGDVLNTKSSRVAIRLKTIQECWIRLDYRVINGLRLLIAFFVQLILAPNLPASKM